MKNDLYNNGLNVSSSDLTDEGTLYFSRFKVNPYINLSALFYVSSASPLDALFNFIGNLLGGNDSPDGYLIYLLVMSGLFIIGAVLIYNWWEEKRFNQEVEKGFSPIKNDALLDENKKQFLEKFAATTGYLSDAPDDASFLAKESFVNSGKHVAGKKPFEDDLSIDDVYTELLDTMSKRSSSREKADEVFAFPEAKIEPIAQVEPIAAVEPVGQVNAVQSHTIKSIIDQVFRSKNNKAEELERNESMMNDSAQQHESVLDAYLNAKNAIEPAIENLDAPNDEQFDAVDRMNAPQMDDVAEDLSASMHLNDSQAKTGDAASNQSSAFKNDEPAANIPESNIHQLKPKAESTQVESSLPALLNPHMDLIGVLELASGTAFSLLVDSFSALYKDYDKPVFVHVLDANRQWVLVNDTSAQVLANVMNIDQPLKIVCSLQLADRSGAVSRNMINRFQLAFDAIAANMGGRVDWKNDGDALTKAMSLDAFCIEVDKTMFFHLTQDVQGAFTGTKLKGIAEAQGLVLASDGAFKCFDDDQDALSQHKQSQVAQARFPAFVMFNRDNHPFSPEMLRTSVVKAVTFQLDIPHIRASAKALDRMVTVAKNLETSLNAVLVDDNNRALGDFQIDKIRDQIKSIHATMQLRGISPGSDCAHRLFS